MTRRPPWAFGPQVLLAKEEPLLRSTRISLRTVCSSRTAVRNRPVLVASRPKGRISNRWSACDRASFSSSARDQQTHRVCRREFMWRHSGVCKIARVETSLGSIPCGPCPVGVRVYMGCKTTVASSTLRYVGNPPPPPGRPHGFRRNGMTAVQEPQDPGALGPQ